MDLELVFQAHIRAGRMEYEYQTLKTAQGIAAGSIKYDPVRKLTGKEGITGVDGSHIYIRDRWAHDKNALQV